MIKFVGLLTDLFPKLLKPRMIDARLFKPERLRFGLRSGSIIPPSTVLAITCRTKSLVCSSTTLPKWCWTPMAIILTIWREDQAIAKTSLNSTLSPSTQKSCRRKSLFFSTSGAILRATTSPKTFLNRTLRMPTRSEKSRMSSM